MDSDRESKRRSVGGTAALLVVGALVGVLVQEFLLQPNADRRFALYNILRELRPAMPRADVEAVIRRHDAAFIRRYDSPDTVALWVTLGGLEMCGLGLRFSGAGELIHAEIGGENGDEQFGDAPPDVHAAPDESVPP